MNITKGKRQIPYKVVIYGPEGIGKSTLASKFPNPIFIDVEGSTARMDVERFDTPKNLDEVILAVDALRTEEHGYQTAIIDTFDRLELMVNDKVCQEQNVAGIEAIGYGKGYTYVAEKVNKLLGKLDALRMSKNMNIVVICHGQMRKFEQPDEMGAYDRWELKLSKKVAPMVKEWADMVLFANYKTYVVKAENGSKKAQGGKRVMYTTHTPCWDAKNRDGLPDQCEFDFAPIAHLFGKTEQPKAEAPKKEKSKKKEEPELQPWSPDMNDIEKKLFELMKGAKVTEDQVIVTFHEKGKFDGIMTIHEINDWEFIERSVIGNWDKFLGAVNKYGKANPFTK